ncbi:VF530 family DNA-binding protein [Veronia pacifica]|uniref:Transporter n=1 Tax=Veronia pacifica TaxID=1080227 RepID=A0A1C3E898_9GAMM|nr:VF530 family protein [Veronia pacifica]ODA29451.1 transporter [Veronia pacifica]
MAGNQQNNPMHGIKLEQIVTKLVEHFGWAVLASEIQINCFRNDPSVKSSLKFLRRTPWARDKVETLYRETFIDGKSSSDPWQSLKPRD